MNELFDPRFLLILAIAFAVVMAVLLPGKPRHTRTCRQCGATHPRYARFCRRCGQRL